MALYVSNICRREPLIVGQQLTGVRLIDALERDAVDGHVVGTAEIGKEITNRAVTRTVSVIVGDRGFVDGRDRSHLDDVRAGAVPPPRDDLAALPPPQGHCYRAISDSRAQPSFEQHCVAHITCREPKAKAALHEIMNAEHREAAEVAVDRFHEAYGLST